MLYEALSHYAEKGVAPFHMPGHKRNAKLLGDGLPWAIDITEIDGFDNLQDPKGILKSLASRAAALFGSETAFPLVNGGTGGILAAVKSAARAGDTVIMARNCHKSVYNAAELFGLNPVYILPDADETGIAGSIRPEQVQKALDAHPGASLVVVTSPTYEGVVSDIGALAAIAHRKNVPLLVDAAHGAHLGFSDFFPPSAVSCGADLVVVSLHKTLPALTQCALALHSGTLVEAGRLREAVTVFQTSSPSYVLLSSIDSCVGLLEAGKERLFDAYIRNLADFDARIKSLDKLRVLCHGADAPADHGAFSGFDPGKLVISARGTDLSGPALAGRLRAEHRIEPEMAGPDYAVAMTSICDEAEHFERLAGALAAIDASAGKKAAKPIPLPQLPPARMTASEAAGRKGVFAALDRAAGRTALEYVWAYPPGIPLVTPGEAVTDVLAGEVSRLEGAGVAVGSTRGRLPDIYVEG
jgi:arginine decarboxylase